METVHREALIKAVESTSEQIGFDLYSGATRLKAWFDVRYPWLVACQTREGLETLLASFPNEGDAKIQEILAVLSIFPTLGKQLVIETAQLAVADIPKTPPGRPVRITPEVKRQVIEIVSRLYAKGTHMAAAQSRAAQQLKLSKRTVQRIWRQRQEIADQPFQSTSDLWKLMGF